MERGDLQEDIHARKEGKGADSRSIEERRLRAS